jgi:hypothetical protein
MIFDIFARISVGTAIYWLWIIPAALLALTSFFFKGVRIYMILMEKRISLKRFSRTYAKTTFVTLALPYKLGDIFRMFCFGNDMKNYVSGFLSVVADRYFDSVPLLIVMLGYILFNQSAVSLITVILFVFVLFGTVVYMIYPYSSQYLNRFLITKTVTTKGLLALSMLDKLDSYYAQITQLVKGRAPLLFLVSIISLSAEYFSILCIARYWGHGFSGNDFFSYLNSVFAGSLTIVTNSYLVLGAMIFALLSLLVYGFHLFLKGRTV